MRASTILKIVLCGFYLSFLHLPYKGNFLSGPHFHEFFSTFILTTLFTVSEVSIAPFYMLYPSRKQNCKGCKEVSKLSPPSPCDNTRLSKSVLSVTKTICLIWPLKPSMCICSFVSPKLRDLRLPGLDTIFHRSYAVCQSSV